MKNLAIARRYAKALLLIGKEENQVNLYGEEIRLIVSLFNENKDLRNVIINPVYNEIERRQLLEEVLNRLSLSKIVFSFLVLLFNKERISFLTYISDYYERFANEVKGIVRAKLISASQLSSEAVDKIREALSNRTGKDIILEVEQDSSLIGGIVTIIGDLVLDGSVKTQLLNMKESLKRGDSI